MPPTLRDFAEGGRYHKVDLPLKPMSGGDFEKWQRGWEQEGGDFEAADKARAEAEEAAQAIVAVNELMAREAAATTPLIILDD
jgi:hypothetical protein